MGFCDFNGDGKSDYIQQYIYIEDLREYISMKVKISYGGEFPSNGNINIENNSFIEYTYTTYYEAYSSINVVDVNSDGKDDIYFINGEKWNDQPSIALYVILGKNDSGKYILKSSYDYKILSKSLDKFQIMNYILFYDLNNDNINDFLIPCFSFYIGDNDTNRGATLVLYGSNETAFQNEIDISNFTFNVVIFGNSSIIRNSEYSIDYGDQMVIKSISDMNKDGFDDLIMIAPGLNYNETIIDVGGFYIVDYYSLYNFIYNNSDADNDDIVNFNDAFPTDPAASIDTDGDGLPDSWNPGKDQSDSTTGLHLDAFPNDPSASIDSDGDGMPDKWNDGMGPENSTTGLTLDPCPNDPDNIPPDDDTDTNGTSSNNSNTWIWIAAVAVIVVVIALVVVVFLRKKPPTEPDDEVGRVEGSPRASR